jgi:hypothetical protein
MRVLMRTTALGSVLLGLFAAVAGTVLAQVLPVQPAPPGPPAVQPGPQQVQPSDQEFSPNEIIDAGHRFFGDISRGLATMVEKAVSQWGLPNGYILGEEGGGAFWGGLRYGEGMLYTKNAGDLRVFWQGPSIGFSAAKARAP